MPAVFINDDAVTKVSKILPEICSSFKHKPTVCFDSVDGCPSGVRRHTNLHYRSRSVRSVTWKSGSKHIAIDCAISMNRVHLYFLLLFSFPNWFISCFFFSIFQFFKSNYYFLLSFS